MSPEKEYDTELQALIKWYQENRISMPDDRFDLCPGTTVIDAPLFYSSIDKDIAAGTKGLHLDMTTKRQLQLLKAYVDSKERSGK